MIVEGSGILPVGRELDTKRNAPARICGAVFNLKQNSVILIKKQKNEREQRKEALGQEIKKVAAR